MTAQASRFRGPLIAAGILGLTGVALGALGAHALAAKLAERGMAHAWETAARYHMLHVLALFGSAVWLRTLGNSAGSPTMTWAARCWIVGTVLFSGSLYWLAIGGPRWLGPVTPFGGVALMAGWACVTAAGFAKTDSHREAR